MLQTWNPKSKTEPHAQSAVEIIKLAKEAVDDFFEIPGMCEDLILYLADSLDSLLQDYTSFVSSCGMDICFQIYLQVPTLFTYMIITLSP